MDKMTVDQSAIVLRGVGRANGWSGHETWDELPEHRKDKWRELAKTAAAMAAETIAAQQAHARELTGEIVHLRNSLKLRDEAWTEEVHVLEGKLATLLVAAGAAYDYFSDKADYDLDGGEFHGNLEASLASELAEAIRRAKGERL